jgi:pimeloyl-ACP methyl ester carboxylesterase
MKRVLFVPGFQENRQSRNYDLILEAFSRSGYKPQFVDINWYRTTQDDWVRQLNIARSQCGFDAAIAGFSFGAVTALLSAADRAPAELWLFSLSTLFAEDAATWTKTDRKIIGKRRLTLASQISFNALARQITCPTYVFVGSREIEQWPEMGRRYEQVVAQCRFSQGSIVRNVGHAIEDRRYVDTVEQQLRFT